MKGLTIEQRQILEGCRPESPAGFYFRNGPADELWSRGLMTRGLCECHGSGDCWETPYETTAAGERALRLTREELTNG